MIGLELVLAGHLLLTQVSANPEPVPALPPTLGRDAPSQCPPAAAPQIDVHWRSEPVKYDMTKNYASLGSRQIDTANPYGTHVSVDVGGLMSGKVNYKSGIEVTGIRYVANRSICLWINKISVDIVIDPTIYIASENPKGTCKFVAILEHESKHVAADRRVVQDHINSIREAAFTSASKVGIVGPKPDEDADMYKEKMSTYVEAALKKAVDAMYADRAQRQKLLDSKEEYDRVQSKCPQ